jgi:ATP-dependent DNA helicase PIF1
MSDNIEPTELFPTRQEVDRANDARMRALPGSAVDFVALDGGTMHDIARRTELLQNCMAPEKLSLKLNAQVMLIKNIDETLVNGSIGKIISFMDEKTYEQVKETGEDDIATEASELIGESKSKIKGMGFRNTNSNTGPRYPWVEFQQPDGTARTLLIVRETWKVEQPNGEVVASRSQVPLIPAWALSIHKAQGQTLERVRVDLGKIFEKGQAYVALSRATTQHGLQILRFDPSKVMAHEKVRKFYDSLAIVGAPKNGETKAPIAGSARPAIADDDSLFLDEYDDEAFAAYAP